MKLSSHVVFALLAVMTQAASAAAQTTPPPAGSAAPPASPPAPPPSSAPAASAAPADAAAPAPSSAAATAAPTGSATPAVPATPTPPPASPLGDVLSKMSADAFVDGYFSFNANAPKPAAFAYLYGQPSLAGGNTFHAFDAAQGFALNWIGVNASYAADPIGATIGLRLGPGAVVYHAGTPDQTAGLQYVKQAYATWKPADKLTLDFGKWDQPFGSEVADSQLNMDYTRSVLFWYAQPLWFTGLRADYAVSDPLDVKVFMANGWNETLKVNRSYSFGAQVMLKPADAAVFYLGYVGGPQQPDAIASANGVMDVPDANDHWRHLVDLVADINPTKQLRFLLNGDYRVENAPGGTGTPDETVYGANLVIRYQVSDPFAVAVRGEYFHDEKGTVLGTNQKTDIEDGTLSLNYAFGSHLAFMFDARYDTASTPDAMSGFPGVFQKNASDATNGQFTATLGVIASTK